jgi:lipopolysaccharide transport system permease protein
MCVKKKDNYWHLLWVIARTDFKLRYYGSVLGYFWALLKPLLMFGVLYVVFTFLMRWDIENYQLYLLLGIIIWNFFVEATSLGLNSLLAKAGLIKKIYFPRILVVVASTLTSFVGLFLNLIVFFVIYFFSGMTASLLFLLLPIYLFLIYLFALGFVLLLSVSQVHYRDVSPIWDILLQAGFFLSPIIYPLAIVPEQYLKYLYLNPMTGIIQYTRMLIIEHELPIFSSAFYLLLFIIFILILGYFVFKKLSKSIAEKI